jgi:hypothetical protein
MRNLVGFGGLAALVLWWGIVRWERTGRPLWERFVVWRTVRQINDERERERRKAAVRRACGRIKTHAAVDHEERP